MKVRDEYVTAARQVLSEAFHADTCPLPAGTNIGVVLDSMAEHVGWALELYYLRGYEAAVKRERAHGWPNDVLAGEPPAG